MVLNVFWSHGSFFFHVNVRVDIQRLSDGPVRDAALIVYSSPITRPRLSASHERRIIVVKAINLKTQRLILVKRHVHGYESSHN